MNNYHPRSILGEVYYEANNFTLDDVRQYFDEWEIDDIDNSYDDICDNIMFDTYQLPLSRNSDIDEHREALTDIIVTRLNVLRKDYTYQEQLPTQ